MRKFIFLITVIAAAYLSVPRADAGGDTLWSKHFEGEGVSAARFTPDGKYVLAAIGNTFCKFDINTGERVSKFKDTCEKYILRYGWSEELNKIATIGYYQKSVDIWDYYMEKMVHSIQVKIDPNSVATCVDISKNDLYLIYGNSNKDSNNMVLCNLTDYL